MAPLIETLDTKDLDKQYIAMNEQIQSSIMTAHQVTSTELFGIQTPGKLGSGTDLQAAKDIFKKTIIDPDKEFIFDTFNNKVLKHIIPNFKLTNDNIHIGDVS